MYKVFYYYTTHMKKALWILSLSVLLFSTFAPSFTYANEDVNELTDLLEEAITQTEQDLWLNDFTQNSDTIYNLQEVKTAELLEWSGFNVKIKKLANNNSSEMTFNTDDTNIEKIIIADTNTEWSSVIVSSSTSENPVYAWYDWDEKAIYLYSEAKTIYLNEDSSFMFYKLKWLRWFQFDMFDITKVKSMKYMFWYYQWEEAVDLRNLDLSKVEDMSFMYYWSNITSINLSWMNLNNVTTMLDFLYKANNLVSADFTNVQLNSVTNIDTMFPYYETEAKLEEVKFTNAKLWALENIGPSLFYKLNNLEYVDFSGVDLHNLKKPWTMFNENNNLKYVNFNYADLRSLEEIWIFNNLPELTWLKFSHTILSWLQYSNNQLVHQTPKLKEIDFSYADLRNLKGRTKDSYETLKWVIEIQNGYAPNVEIFNFSNADLRSITTLQSMFSQTTTLKEVNFENTRLDNLITMEDMFKGAKLPEKIKFKNNHTNNLTNMKEMFYGSYSWNFIDLSWLDLSSVGTMYQMFKNAKDIKKVSFKNANLKKVWTMENMFYEAKDIEEVDFEWAEFENLVTMKGMFEETNIKEFNFTGKNLKYWISFWNMFRNAKNLEKVNFSNNIINWTTTMTTMFDYATGLKEADFSNNKINWTVDMWNMFWGTTNLIEVNFKNLEAKWWSMGSVFYNCSSLEKIDFSNMKISWWFNMWTFFYQADNLKEVNFSNSIFNWNWNYWSFISRAPNLEKVDFSNTVFSWWGNMYTFFYDTNSLKEANFSWTKFIWNYNLQWMFADKPNLEKINFENSEINGDMYMKEMFKDTTKLKELDLTSWDTSKITNMNSMFKWATNLKTIYVWNNFKTTSVTDSENMFSWAISIVWWNWTTYNSEKIDKEYAVIDDENNSWYFTHILDKKYTITYIIDPEYIIWDQSTTGTYSQKKWVEFKKAAKPWYELEYWYESWHNEAFVITENTKWDKTLYPKWKALKEKAQETASESVVYTNETTVTIWDDIQEETINNSSLINLVSKEVENHEVKAEEEKITVKESEIKVTSDKTVEYEWWLEVYLEKTENVWTENEVTEKVEGTIKFSSPVAVKIPITSNAETVKVQVKHEWEEFGYNWLTTNPVNSCSNGEAVNNKYNWENISVTNNNNKEKYALIYTCSASTFVAYTENTKQSNNTTSVSSPAAWGWRAIISTKSEKKSAEQEHNSADTEKPENTTTDNVKNSNPTVSENLKEQVIKVQERSLTRWEVAVMTNILLDVYPQLTENRELNEVSKASENYADEQNFTKDEKKAITRLCKLSIMGIHADDNKPLDEFMVNEITKNDEFSKVINRSLSTYTEKDFSVVKEALKKLEWNEENVVFGTVYDVFMGIKNIFN